MVVKIYEPVIWSFLLMMTSQLSAFPTGGPSYSCKNLEPAHSNGTQPSVPPYTVAVSSQTLQAGGRTRVSIESTTDFPFRGFICAVSDLLDDKHNTVGQMFLSPSFQQPNLIQPINCARSTPDTGMTHTSKEDKWRVEFEWRAPVSARENQQYKLRCTVVQSFFRCWTGIQTILTIRSNNPGNGPSDSSVPNTSGTSGRSSIPTGPVMGNINPPSPPQNAALPGNANNGDQGGLFQNANAIPFNNGDNAFNTRASPNEVNTNTNPSTSRTRLGNNSVSPNGGQQSGNDNVLSPSSDIGLDVNNNNPNPPLRRIPTPSRSVNQGRNGFNSNINTRLPPTPVTRALSRPNTLRRQGASNNQPTNFPQPLSNPGLPGQNGIITNDVLSEFERAVILELLRMGFQPRNTNSNANMGTNNVRRRNFNNAPNSEQFSLPISNTNPNLFAPSNSDSRFQNAGLVRSDALVFDPFSNSVAQNFRRNTVTPSPNSRGLFQTLNSRTFNPEFSRIRRRNR